MLPTAAKHREINLVGGMLPSQLFLKAYSSLTHSMEILKMVCYVLLLISECSQAGGLVPKFRGFML
jgi:hypothetical protein